MKRSFAVVAFVSLALAEPGMAQTPDQNVCAILAQHLKPDVLQQGSAGQQFLQIQQLVSDQQYADWSKASSSSSSFNGSLSIPAIVDVASSNSTNW